MLTQEEFTELYEELRPIVYQLSEKLLPNQAIKLTYEIGSVSFDVTFRA